LTSQGAGWSGLWVSTAEDATFTPTPADQAQITISGPATSEKFNKFCIAKFIFIHNI